MAQLVAHLLCKQRVRGSSPLTSTNEIPKLRLRDFLCLGFGGCRWVTTPPLRLHYLLLVDLHGWARTCALARRHAFKLSSEDSDFELVYARASPAVYPGARRERNLLDLPLRWCGRPRSASSCSRFRRVVASVSVGLSNRVVLEADLWLLRFRGVERAMGG